ncbi:putative regulator of Ras-like GTPase activity (Roadblock/LC7/MglB family) [Geothermobacter ehrlichii]|uniref:Putative regulator of Ras-like GTPase activity (Roadblock/LC7/MglB family) n=1 Tax=Geothermobacter ehrlichii TaxID=213224 RepID=A0A5D3WN74_9BACT|nr:roadblock/LC7 domain-containing protein [Geothermobacter ehrlichii]TYO99964.1 putative regulator of Ras-like GTPase activity (Roadblock/LC7/MglB family) [Geothermobacter ehrlichii]
MFADILKTIVEETRGGAGAVLMGYDGIAIDQYFKPVEGLDLQLVAVEYANILKDIKRTAEILDSGDMEEVSIRTGRFYVLIRILNDDYFVALTLDRDGNFGKGRYLLMREAPNLRAALE